MKKDPSSSFNFSEQQKAIMECSYRYEDDDIITVLPILFYGSSQLCRKLDNYEIADSFFQCSRLYQQKSSYLESTNAYISAVDVYISKSRNDTRALIKNVKNLLKIVIESISSDL